MENNELKCRWCAVHLLEDGCCPNPAHPKICPFCRSDIDQMICTSATCCSNQKTSRRHSSFPPRVSLSYGQFLQGDMMEGKAARALGHLHQGVHMSGSDELEEDEPTKPAMKILPMTRFSIDSVKPKLVEEVAPKKERISSGVFLVNSDLTVDTEKETKFRS